MYNYKIKTSFVSPEMPKARVNKTRIKLIFFIIRRKLSKIRYMIFQYDLKPVLIEWILIFDFV